MENIALRTKIRNMLQFFRFCIFIRVKCVFLPVKIPADSHIALKFEDQDISNQQTQHS